MADPSAPLLFGPATEDNLTPVQTIQLPLARASRDIKSAYPLYISRLAVDSDTIAIEVDGKSYRFVGTMRSAANPPMDFWTGETSHGDSMEITRTSDSMSGSIRIGDRVLEFGGSGQYVVFFERNLNPRPQTLEEQASEQERTAKAEAYRREASSLQSMSPTKAEQCADERQALMMRSEVLHLPQPPRMRRWLEEGLASMKSRQTELGCSAG